MGLAEDLAARALTAQTPQAPQVVPNGQIADVLLQRLGVEPEPEPPAEELGFFARIGGRLAERGAQLQEIAGEDVAPPATTVESLERGLQVLGTGAGAALDVGGEVISTGFGLLSQAASAVTPDFIEDPIVSKVGDAFEAIVGTEIAQAGLEAAGQGIEAYQVWAEANPRAARNVAALANIALVAAPVKVRPRAAPKPTVVGRAGEALGRSADAQVASERAIFVEGLVRPKTTAKVREAEALRTTGGGVLEGFQVAPSAAEQAIAKTVSDVAGVKPGNSLVQNMTAIQTAIETEATTLVSSLKATGVKIPRPDIKADMDGILARLGETTLITGDAAKTAKRFLGQARTFLGANPATPAGVLNARKQFDKWVTAQKPKLFDAAVENAQTVAATEIRRTMNDIVAKSVPDVGVRQSLAKQSDLISARGNITPKIAVEVGASAATALGRLRQRIAGVTGLSTRPVGLVDLGIIAGAGGGFAMSPAAMLGITAALGAGVALKKVPVGRSIKRATSKLLRQSEKAIQTARKQGNMDLVKQLRADRAAVVELFRNMEITTEEER